MGFAMNKYFVGVDTHMYVEAGYLVEICYPIMNKFNECQYSVWNISKHRGDNDMRLKISRVLKRGL